MLLVARNQTSSVSWAPARTYLLYKTFHQEPSILHATVVYKIAKRYFSLQGAQKHARAVQAVPGITWLGLLCVPCTG